MKALKDVIKLSEVMNEKEKEHKSILENQTALLEEKIQEIEELSAKRIL